MADPICTCLFSILVMYTTIPIAKECIGVLMEGAPMNIELEKFSDALNGLEGV